MNKTFAQAAAVLCDLPIISLATRRSISLFNVSIILPPDIRVWPIVRSSKFVRHLALQLFLSNPLTPYFGGPSSIYPIGVYSGVLFIWTLGFESNMTYGVRFVHLLFPEVILSFARYFHKPSTFGGLCTAPIPIRTSDEHPAGSSSISDEGTVTLLLSSSSTTSSNGRCT